MHPATARNYRCLQRRFVRFQTDHPGPLVEQARAFLAGLCPAVAHTARYALRAQFDGQIPWAGLPRRPYRRNLARLQATLFDGDECRRVTTIPETEGGRALLLTLWTLRRCEVARLRWRDVDLRRGVVGVYGGKGGTNDWTLLNPAA